MKDRIGKFLDESLRKDEFSHTVIHGTCRERWGVGGVRGNVGEIQTSYKALRKGGTPRCPLQPLKPWPLNPTLPRQTLQTLHFRATPSILDPKSKPPNPKPSILDPKSKPQTLNRAA